MQFLWELLPGAREARNSVIVGYVWLAALALWFGVPDVETNSNLDQLLDAIGPVGGAAAASFAAFLIGSFWVELLKLTPARAAMRTSRALTIDRPDAAVDLLRVMDQSEAAELERLEAGIAQASAEMGLRVQLMIPVVIAGAAGAGDSWLWPVAALALAVALWWQARQRYFDRSGQQEAVASIREAVVDRLPQEDGDREP